MKSARRTFLLFTLLLILGLGGFVYLKKTDESFQPQYRLAKVEKGPIVSTVSATGTLNAVVTVKVGSQISGQITELLVDFNSEVEEKQIIARIDPDNFEARVRQAKAELAVARANVAIQRAAIEKHRADLANVRASFAAAQAKTQNANVAVTDTGRDLKRKRKLHKGTIIADSEIDKAVAAHDQALAQMEAARAEERARASLVRSQEAALKMAKGQVVHALAQVEQKEAMLHQCEVDLEHTFIRSPVDGVVIERNVDIGQTVAASLQAPTLFTIAKDLREMQVDTSMDEADIGRIRVGQKATFTVDAFPRRTFHGRIGQIRKSPQTVQNVVTYTVVVTAENPDLTLLPGMTANVKIVVDERPNALKVANAALRFRPPGHQKAGSGESGRGLNNSGSIGGPSRAGERMDRLIRELELDEEQQAQLRDLFQGVRKQIKAMREKGAGRDEIRQEIEAIRQKNRSAIMAFLTPQQREKFRNLARQRAYGRASPGRVWIIEKGGQPSPVEVMVGIDDGSFSEIVKGGLVPGQDVIVGIARDGGRSAGRKRRFLF